MLLHDARRAARATAGGDIVLLEEQDRTLWDHPADRRRPEAGGRGAADAGPAAILCGAGGDRRVACAGAELSSDTDWPQIAGLYEVLLRISPSPVIELNHAAAVSMVDGPARALDLIDALEARGGLNGYELTAGGSRRSVAPARPVVTPRAKPILRPPRRRNWSRCGGSTRGEWRRWTMGREACRIRSVIRDTPPGPRKARLGA